LVADGFFCRRSRKQAVDKKPLCRRPFHAIGKETFADGQAVGEERTSVKKIFADGQTVGK
jgi:hypothetical protein